MLTISFKEWLHLFEQAGNGFAYVGNAVIIPSAHGAEAGSTKITPPPDDMAKQYAKNICEKYGYWYEGIGEERGGGNGPEKTYCENVLGVANPKNNGSYDDRVTMTGFYAGVPTFSSVAANWPKNSPKIDFKNSNTIGDALRSALANGAGTFARAGVNIKLSEPEIKQIFDVVRQVFPQFEQQKFRIKNKAAEFKQWLLQAEDYMWEQKGNALSKLGDAAETERKIQIINFAKANGGILFLGAGHFPRLKGVSWAVPTGQQNAQPQPNLTQQQ